MASTLSGEPFNLMRKTMIGKSNLKPIVKDCFLTYTIENLKILKTGWQFASKPMVEQTDDGNRNWWVRYEVKEKDNFTVNVVTNNPFKNPFTKIMCDFEIHRSNRICKNKVELIFEKIKEEYVALVLGAYEYDWNKGNSTIEDAIQIKMKISYVEDLHYTLAPTCFFDTKEELLNSSFSSFLEGDMLSDVTIGVEDKIIPAHAIILAANSPVFQSMFKTNMTENLNRYIIIEEFDHDTVIHFLRYLYTRQLPDILDPDVYMALLKIAHKYNVQNLVEACIDQLIISFKMSTIISTIILADMLCLPRLKQAALNYATVYRSFFKQQNQLQEISSHSELMIEFCLALAQDGFSTAEEVKKSD